MIDKRVNGVEKLISRFKIGTGNVSRFCQVRSTDAIFSSDLVSVHCFVSIFKFDQF